MWHKVAKVGDLGDNQAQHVRIGEHSIALFNLANNFYAISNTCAHRGSPLVTGHVEDGKVTCAWHAWEFDIKTGKCHTMPGTCQKTYPTKVEKNEVFVDC